MVKHIQVHRIGGMGAVTKHQCADGSWTHRFTTTKLPNARMAECSVKNITDEQAIAAFATFHQAALNMDAYVDVTALSSREYFQRAVIEKIGAGTPAGTRANMKPRVRVKGHRRGVGMFDTVEAVYDPHPPVALPVHDQPAVSLSGIRLGAAMSIVHNNTYSAEEKVAALKALASLDPTQRATPEMLAALELTAAMDQATK